MAARSSREPKGTGGLRVSFLGAVGTVTGSRYRVEAGDTQVLVDCGLYQGVKQLRLRNRRPFSFDPETLDALLLTHAHVDHSGMIPVLVRDGLRGPVLCSEPTRDLSGVVLPDAGHLQEEDAGYANRKGFSRHQPALPLYTEEDARTALERFAPVPFHAWQRVGSLEFRLIPAGHILGAASVEVRAEGRILAFSGDLGRSDDLLMHPPESPEAPDWVVIESTYGDRLHEARDPIRAIAEVLGRTLDRGGVLLVPAFAVGRTQTFLYCLHEIFERGLAPRVPVYVNSPMATDVTDLFRRSVAHHRLTEAQCRNVCDVATYTRTPEASRELVQRRGPMVIVSASGMASGGRVLHHLRALAPDRRNTILLPGFQAPGTRGDALVHGARTIRIHGQEVPVEAEVVQLDLLSAHADQDGLLAWIRDAGQRPERVFVTHGEPVASDALRRRIEQDLHVPASVPELGETFDIDVPG